MIAFTNLSLLELVHKIGRAGVKVAPQRAAQPGAVGDAAMRPKIVAFDSFRSALADLPPILIPIILGATQLLAAEQMLPA